MPWPKGRPRKPKTEDVQAPEALTPQPTYERKGKPPGQRKAATLREGGKAALMAENADIETAQKKPDEEKSTREKLADQYTKEEYDLEPSQETGEQVQEEQETSSASEEEQSEEQESEEVPSESAEEQESEKKYSEKEYKAAVDRMHQATTETSNYRKYLEEIAPHVNWDAYTKGRGETTAGPIATEQKVEKPTQEEFISDHDKYLEKLVKYIDSHQSPQVQNIVTRQNEINSCRKAFNEEFKDLPGGPQMFEPVLTKIITDQVQKDPTLKTRPPNEIYGKALPEFRKFAETLKPAVKQPTKKKLPVESPSKLKEREPTGPEKPYTWDDYEKSNRDFVKFRIERTRELKGN